MQKEVLKNLSPLPNVGQAKEEGREIPGLFFYFETRFKFP